MLPTPLGAGQTIRDSGGGVDSGYTPMPLRRKVWERLATDLKPRHLPAIAHTIALDEVQDYCARMLKGQIRGRAVVKLDQ